MRNLLIALTGILVGAGLIAAVALGVPRQAKAPAAGIPIAGTMGGGMTGTVSASATTKL